MTDDEVGAVLRPPKKDADPYARLEFFKEGDLPSKIRYKPPATAMPVEEEDVVPATRAREELIRRLDEVRSTRLRELMQEGKVTQKDLRKLYDLLKDAQGDSALEFYLDNLLHPEGGNCVEYPVEGEAERVDRKGMSFLEQLRFDYQVPSYVEFESLNLSPDMAMPIVRLSHCNGEEAVITLHGGCILSWTALKQKDRLYQDPDEKFDGVHGIKSSGITVAFPQYGKSGALPTDGFANALLWDVVRSEIGADWLPDPAPSVTLFCKDNEETRRIWPYAFEMYYKVTLGEIDDFEDCSAPTKDLRHFQKRAEELGTLKEATAELRKQQEEEMETAEKEQKRRRNNATPAAESSDDTSPQEGTEPVPTQIRIQITVCNTGDKPMEFMCACRTHLQTRRMGLFGDFIQILGLGGRYYLDYNIVPGKPMLRAFDKDYLTLSERGEGWNAIFTENVENDVLFCPGYQEHFESIQRHGLPDVLLSHPGRAKLNNPATSEHMIMLGRGRVAVPASLQPGEKWEGEYVLRHHDEYFTEPIFGYEHGLPPPEETTIDPPVDREPLKAVDIRS